MKNNRVLNILSAMALVLLFLACDKEYDNYQSPNVVFQGKLIDTEGDDFQFDASKSLFAFYQSGYGKTDIGTGMNTTNEGKFRQLLFRGDYTLTLTNNAYPFEIAEFPANGSGQGYDSLHFHVTGDIDVTYTVRPYYKVTAIDAVYDETKKQVVATFSVKRLAEDAPPLKRAYLYLGTAVNVNSSNKCTRMTTLKPKGEDVETFTAMIPVAYYRNKNYGMINNTRSFAFYRVGLMVTGYNDYYLFSQTKKIEGLTDLQ